VWQVGAVGNLFMCCFRCAAPARSMQTADNTWRGPESAAHVAVGVDRIGGDAENAGDAQVVTRLRVMITWIGLACSHPSSFFSAFSTACSTSFRGPARDSGIGDVLAAVLGMESPR